MKCKQCRVEFEILPSKYASGDFCTTKCARVFAAFKSVEPGPNKLRSAALKGRPSPHKGKRFGPWTPEQRAAHAGFSMPDAAKKKISDAFKGRPLPQSTRDKISLAMKARVDAGIHSGWKSRSKVEPSFAERTVSQWLTEEGFNFEREKLVGKWFIDFAIGNVALEIDGKQHDYPDRAVKDAEKDKFLSEAGWRVVRVPWKLATPQKVISAVRGVA